MHEMARCTYKPVELSGLTGHGLIPRHLKHDPGPIAQAADVFSTVLLGSSRPGLAMTGTVLAS